MAKEIEKLEECRTLKDIEAFYMKTYNCDLKGVYKLYSKTDLEEILDMVTLQDTKAVDFTASIQENTTIMSENYDSFNENYENFKICLNQFIEKNPVFKSLKNKEKELLEFGDFVGILNKKGHGICQCTFEEEAVIEFNNEMLMVKKSLLRPFDDYITKLNGGQLAQIYQEIQKIIKFKRSFTIVDYFSMFCDYFSTNEKDLYNSLNFSCQEDLLREISKSSQFFSRQKRKKFF